MKRKTVDVPTILERDWENVKELFTEKVVGPKTVLLREGDISESIFFVKSGLLRMWNNDDGRDISIQFFVEGQVVSSFESFYMCEPSLFTLESIEETELLILSKKNLEALMQKNLHLEHDITEIVSRRFIDYVRYFLSRIKEKPEIRYKNLLELQPELSERVPDHYLASYLGITPVSLLRIKNRIKNS